LNQLREGVIKGASNIRQAQHADSHIGSRGVGVRIRGSTQRSGTRVPDDATPEISRL